MLCPMAVSFECTTESLLPGKRLFDLSRDITVRTESMTRSRERAVGGVRTGALRLRDIPVIG
jgi:hypothetical protein